MSTSPSTSRQVPTINDLRLKLCYICREEELYDAPGSNPPRAWTHPCNCTLVAHETCLLQWIQTAQSSPTKANALKCPQCGATYEIESDKPTMYKLLERGNKTLSTVARLVTGAGVVSIVITIGTGIYIVSTAYGMYAVREFIGQEMYNLLLSDDSSVWPWHAFVNLPLIPFALMLSRTSLSSSALPIFLMWPVSRPVISATTSYTITADSSSATLPSLFSWPPSPTLFMFVVLPTAKMIYSNLISRLTHYVLKTAPAPRRVGSGRNRRRNGANRVVYQLRLGVGEEPPAEEAQPPAVAAAAVDEAERDAINANAAEQIIHVTTASLGRIVGGALVIPPLASFTGSLLLRLSRHVPLLKAFLGVKPPLRTIPTWDIGLPIPHKEWDKLAPWWKMGSILKMCLEYVGKGSRLWSEADPVWWRNSIGLGLFIVVKDCVHILHLWHVKRELASRRVKSKSFAGVDVKELDLIDPSRWTSSSG